MTEPKLSLDSIVVQKPDQLAAEIRQEVVMMSVARGEYYGLDAIGSDIWRRIATPIRVADLCRELAGSYDGDAVAIRAEALAFLQKLADKGLLDIRN
jgi:hypothetical protein